MGNVKESFLCFGIDGAEWVNHLKRKLHREKGWGGRENHRRDRCDHIETKNYINKFAV